MPEVLEVPTDKSLATRFPPEKESQGSVNPKRARTRGDQLYAAAKKWAQALELPKEFADPSGYLQWVLLTGRDPLEGLINRTDGDKSPFLALIKEIALVIESGETVPKLPRKDREVYEHLEDKLRARGWVPLKTRLAIAKILMPYYHHRLASVEVTGAEGGPVKWQEAASKMAMSDAGVRGMAEAFARRAASGMGTQSDSHIISKQE